MHPFAKSHRVDSPKGSRPGTRPDDSLPPAHRSGRARDYVNAAKRRVTSDSGNNSIDERLVDETLDAYVDWREECAGVRDAYRRWSTAPLSHVTDAFREYRTALDNEEHAANHYAQLIRRLTQHASARPQNQRDERHWRPAQSWWRRRGGVTRDASTKENPMEFLVEFDVNVPDGASASEVELRYGAEASAAARLVDEGHLVRLWRPPAAPGETKALGLYRADSEAQLAGLLGALPLYDWMNITITPLEPHPNDPEPQATVSTAARSRP